MSSSRSSRVVWGGLAAALTLSIAAAGAPALAADDDPLIDYPTFKGAGKSLDRNGAADLILSSGDKVRQKILRLTPGGYRQSGSAWSLEKLDVTQSFESAFKVYLHHFRPGADGIAFVVQTEGPRALGGWGGGLGYRGIKPSLAVEFDTYQNSYDPSRNHLAVVLGGNPDYQEDTTEAPIPLFGKPFNARIVYDAEDHRLRVYVKALSAGSTEQLVLERGIDLAQHVRDSEAWIGFTASTGTGLSKQDIYSWTVHGSGV
ncbi:L-type lectin-domain containing protein [Actinoplanes sp. TRM 88003]|uniref:L-type lectin-domain containing protein n=1 Tax=Paractinoplanes aksuensis TaxID=2939490 RepID=A0ABT1DIP2_9ACTN|nr:L-type lectin-domain containing protein [Actinoplanes aksuensis]MCO8270699.1 L-type lectin-domain containing protein [Actinoplanes aksuensis]